MPSTRKGRWQQATALVSLSTCGAMTGFSVAHGSVADLTSPSSVPVKLMALNKPAGSPAASDSALRASIVKAARYYLSLAQGRSPAAMEALIWQNDSVDGVDHGESCAAFASLVLESGAQATGQQSWVTGGSTYPWPVHSWVDSRVDPNPDSLGVTSILQDAQAHNRWHPLGDGYTPQPGDWVLFDGHVEVVTKYAGGVLYTIGGDSMPNMSVNAHEYDGPLAAQGVTGFVNNGVLLSAVSEASGGAQGRSGAAGEAAHGRSSTAQSQPVLGQADIPGTAMPALSLAGTAQSGGQGQAAPSAAAGGTAAGGTAITATATIPGAVPIAGSVISYSSVIPSARYSRSQAAPSTASVPDTSAQQAFIAEVAPGALAAQHQYGIPAAVTIAQAIDESGWGQSMLAAQDNNLFGIKGTGPAGSVERPTQEYENGQAVTVNAPFRVYSNVAQSITDHSLLLATGSAYQRAMADRRSPDAFANDLTDVYATDPNYGANLITIMRQFNLYRFDAGTSAAHGAATASRSAAASGSTQSGAAQGGVAQTGSAQSTADHGGTERSGSTQGGSGQSGAGQSTVEYGGSGAGGAAAGQLGQAMSGTDAEGSGGASIPGLDVYAGTAASSSIAAAAATSAHLQPAGGQALRAGPRNVHVSTRRYVTQMPRVVLTDFITTAKIPLLRAKPVYQQVAEDHGVRWELLAACDWMQCQAAPGVSPVFGEDLGTKGRSTGPRPTRSSSAWPT
jgi:flagellum-specific peptidoglycan hydrolase FlgJ